MPYWTSPAIKTFVRVFQNDESGVPAKENYSLDINTQNGTVTVYRGENQSDVVVKTTFSDLFEMLLLNRSLKGE